MAKAKVKTLSDFRPDKKNANRGTERGSAMIATSLRECGAGRSILVDKAGVIIAGNKTVENARAIGMNDVIVVPSDGRKLIVVQRTDLDLAKDPLAKQLAIADNRSSETSLQWDAAVLKDLGEEMDLRPFFTDEELKQITGKSGKGSGAGLATDAVPEARIDQAAELQKKWATAEGQEWEIPSRNAPGKVHRVMCGDSTNSKDVRKLLAGDQADLINTDPPYGVDYNSNATGAIANDAKKGKELATMILGALKAAVANSKPGAAFYIWHASSTRRDFECALDAAALREKQYIVWVKDSFVLGRSDYHWQSEPCFYAEKCGHSAEFYGDRTQSTIWRLAPTAQGGACYSIANGLRLFTSNGSELFLQAAPPKSKAAKMRVVRLAAGSHVDISTDTGNTDAWAVSHERTGMLHPNQKPPALAQRAIVNSTQPGGLVLDLFGGAGFTMIGAELSGRRSATMELDPKFVAVELQRMQDMGLTPRKLR